MRRPDLASQWQLMWWKFRRHKLAMVGLGAARPLPGLRASSPRSSVPIRPTSAIPNYVTGAPMMPRFFEADGTFHLRPFVYGRKTERDMVTLQLKHAVDTSSDLADPVLRARQALQAARSDPDGHPAVRRRPGLHSPLRHRLHRSRHLLAHHPRIARLARRGLRRRRDLLHPRRSDRRRGRLFRRTARQHRHACDRVHPLDPDAAALAGARRDAAARLVAALDLSRHHHHPVAARLDVARADRAQQAARHPARAIRARCKALRMHGRPHHPPPPAAVLHELPDRRHLDRISRRFCWPRRRCRSSALACASRSRAGACCSSRRRASARSTRRPG